MSKNNIIPNLRFPEFVSAGNWEERFVDEFFSVGSSKRVLQEDWTNSGVPFYRTRELVSLSKNEPFGSEIFISEDLFLEISEKYGIPTEGDFLVSGVGTLGICYQVKAGDRFYFKDGNVLWFKLEKGIDSTYFKFCFQSNYIQNQIVKQTSISTVGTYTIQNAKKTTLWYPPKPQEQQKIASCLSSLDEVIAAHSQKLDLLKNHKKGLMQNLFPDPSTSSGGEKVPKYRFKEFEKDGEWMETTVEKLIQENILFAPKDGNHGNIHPKSSDYVKTGIPFIMASDIKNGRIDFTKCAYLKKEQADSLQKGFANKGDVLLTHKGTVGEVAFLNELEFPYIMLTPQVTYYRVKEKSKMANIYLAAFFRSDSFQKNLLSVSGGGTRAYVGITEQQKLGMVFPKNIEEQQKIASCLSSLDALITAQTDKIEQLKLHKKGLMQGLFPKMSEL